MTTIRTTEHWAAIGIAAAIGVRLIGVSPFMLLLGACGGSDSGSIAGGLAEVVGVPWALYLASTIGMGFLVRWRWPLAGLAIALCQLAAVISIGRYFVPEMDANRERRHGAPMPHCIAGDP